MNKASPDPAADQAFDAAIGFVIRIQADPLDPELLAALDQWRRSDTAHERAWQEAAEIHGMSGRVLARGQGSAGNASRRGFLLGGLALGGAGLLGAGPGLVRAARADHLTGTAEIAEIALADGTVLTLGPESAVAVDRRGDQGVAPRGIQLLDGLAICTVPAGGEQPFRLRVGELEVQAQGAAVVSGGVAGGVARVSVVEGRVWAPLRGEAAHLGPGDSLREGLGELALHHGVAEDAFAWRDARLVVDDEAVASVVADIARWIPGRVVIADPWLGAERVGGVFDLSRPQDALAAAVQPHGGKVRQIAPFLSVVTRF